MPTIKQKLAFKKVLKGMPITRAMKAVNYSPKTAANTGKLTRSLGWQELLDKHISEEALTKVHAEGLAATKIIALNDERVTEPDYAVRHKYLETGYKVRNRLKESQSAPPTVNLNFFNADQLRRIAGYIQTSDPVVAPQPDSIPDSDQ